MSGGVLGTGDMGVERKERKEGKEREKRAREKNPTLMKVFFCEIFFIV